MIKYDTWMDNYFHDECMDNKMTVFQYMQSKKRLFQGKSILCKATK